MLNLLADTLRILHDTHGNSIPLTDTETWLSAFLTKPAVREDTNGQDYLVSNPSGHTSATTHYRGYADTIWLCTVGFGCVCEDDCQ